MVKKQRKKEYLKISEQLWENNNNNNKETLMDYIDEKDFYKG